ncbi:MAG: SMI1/KNR4 family protein [Planctomycetaceae bacterium]|nr:SMI1/KNR4 family protein [Planctomycetaceae bacterium]
MLVGMATPRKRRRPAAVRKRMGVCDRLKAILSPPSACLYRPDAKADRQLQNEVGQPLPSSYSEFLACYGPGYIRTQAHDLNFLTVYEPARILSQNRLFYNALGEPLPRSDWPQIHWAQPGGWLMWGYSCDGHQYYWRREGEPDDWPIMVEDRYSHAREEFDLRLPDFLYAVLTGGIDPSGVPTAIKSQEKSCLWTPT